jgi:hypothetical protein|tara:strand:- start:657 stop:1823 length:1167 start_codon:yes stop_codon:yes gene_type:complete
MHYFEFGKRDASIYSGGTTGSINTGLDEILEINKVVNDNGTVGNVSRVLIDFDLAYISQSIQDGKIPSTAKYYLNLFDATSEEVEAEQRLHVYMVSGSWKQGTGKLDHDPVTSDGVSYQYRDHEAKTPWVTGSILTEGGTWFTASYASGQEYNVSASYDLTFDKKDVRADVTDLVKNFIYSSSIYPNNGFIVKREDSGSYGNNHATASFDYNSGQEGDSSRLGNLKYFSRETHTIYPPKLEVEWDDSSWSTGSLSPLTSTDLERLKVYFKNLRTEYKEKTITKLRIVGRELYPTTAFATTPAELDVKYLPSASAYYSVRDAETEEVIIPFGSGSRISCDSTSNFFNIQMDGLQAERNYRFCLKVVSGSGTTDEQINFYDDNYEFRVVR